MVNKSFTYNNQPHVPVIEKTVIITLKIKNNNISTKIKYKLI